MKLLLILLQVVLWDSLPNAVVHQDSAIFQLMTNHWLGKVKGETEISGWRVQIYSSNNQLAAKQEAEDLRYLLQSEISEPIYVDFIQPFWKVRIGNFRTIEEAKVFRDKLVEQFPALQAESYPVKDNIIIKQ